ncbi:integrase-like protein [Streptomyces sp. Ag109_O5-1]|nr:integrase-like protein [Streptomyces sp. Ag109_O5-1]
MVLLDVKKVGRIPDGGGWRIHGRDSDQAKVASRAKSAGAKRGYVYLRSVVDGLSRLAYTEPLGDVKGATAAAFLARAKVWFAAHGINHIHRVVTDNGACYRSGDFARIVGQGTRHQRTKPYTPRNNGKVERYQRVTAAEVLVFAQKIAVRTEDGTNEPVARVHHHVVYLRQRRPADHQRHGVRRLRPHHDPGVRCDDRLPHQRSRPPADLRHQPADLEPGRDPAPGRDTSSVRYGWLGGKQRSSETVTGATLMGVRLYDRARDASCPSTPYPAAAPTRTNTAEATRSIATTWTGDSGGACGTVSGECVAGQSSIGRVLPASRVMCPSECVPSQQAAAALSRVEQHSLHRCTRAGTTTEYSSDTAGTGDGEALPGDLLATTYSASSEGCITD